MDKTKIIYHEDEKCKKNCRIKRLENAPITPERAKRIAFNNEAGRKIKERMMKERAEKEAKAKVELTDNQFIDKLVEQRNK